MAYIKYKKIKKIIFLTPFKGNLNQLDNCIKANLEEIGKQDTWIIVLDNLGFNIKNISFDKRIIILNYFGISGAGNARNNGLDFIIGKNFNNFLLWPFDSDDSLVRGSRTFVLEKFNQKKYSIMSFGIREIHKYKKVDLCFSGVKTYRDLLNRYCTPCGSTVIGIEDSKILNLIRFGKRKRANDQLFFLTAVKVFKKCFFYKKIILLNSRVYTNSLSYKKWKQPMYKFLALKDLNLTPLEIIFYWIKYIYINLHSKLFTKI